MWASERGRDRPTARRIPRVSPLTGRPLMSQLIRRISSALGLATLVSLGTGPDARADLDAYVRGADGAFAWTSAAPRELPQGTVHDIALTSQVWQGITWEHQLQIFVPKGVAT